MTHAKDSGSGTSQPLWWRIFRVVAVTLSIVVGLAMVLVAFTFGSCSAFGGTCPGTPEPILEDDTFVFAAVGAGIAVGIPVFLSRPSGRRLIVALASGATAAVLVGLLARSGA